MWVDLALDDLASSRDLGCLARNELNAVVAILPFLFPSSTYCTTDFVSFVSAADVPVLVSNAIAIPVKAETPPLTIERRETPEGCWRFMRLSSFVNR
jgi:hypothetical protein